MGGWGVKFALGVSFASVVPTTFQQANAQSLDEAILAAITRSSADGTFSPSYCASNSSQSLINLALTEPSGPSIDSQRDQFGPNLARICAPFGNTIGGSSLGSGNIYSLTSSRTVGQRKARAMRQEFSTLTADERRRKSQSTSEPKAGLRPYYQLASLDGGVFGLSLDESDPESNNWDFNLWVEADYDSHERQNTQFTNGYETDSEVGRAGVGLLYAPWDLGLSIEIASGKVEGQFDVRDNVIGEETLIDAFGRDIRLGLPPATADAQFNALPTGSFSDVCLVNDETKLKVSENGAAIAASKGLGGFYLDADVGIYDYDTNYLRTACVVRGEGDSSPQATYHGALIGGASEVREQFVGLSVSKPIHFDGFTLTPRVSTRFSETEHPEYEEVGLQGVFRRVTASTGPRADDGSAELQVTDQQLRFPASGLELVFLEHRSESWVSSAGISGQWTLPADWGDVSLQGGASYNYEARNSQQQRSFRFKEDFRPDPSIFEFQLDPPNTDWVEYNFALSVGFNSGVRPFVSVSAISMHDYSSGWGAVAGIAKSF